MGLVAWNIAEGYIDIEQELVEVLLASRAVVGTHL